MLQLALNSSEDALKDSKKFLDEHLTQWIADFSRDVQKHALTEFYRGAAIILKGFIAEDLKLLNELLDQ